MKIGMVCYPTFGGSGVLATELGKVLAKKGHQVHFISYKQPERLDFFSENLFYHEVHVPPYPLFENLPYGVALASKLVDIITNEKLDILHVHYAIPHATAAFLARQILETHQIFTPFITTLHGTDITLVGRDISYQPVVSFSINVSDGVTSVSEQLRQDTFEYFSISRDIKVITNFVDLTRFYPHSNVHCKKSITSGNERIIVHASNFRKVKRIQDIIHVFAGLLHHIPSKLLMVGDGPERIKAERLCRDLNISDHVSFLGHQKLVEEIFSISDLFILPSEQESFGLAVLEAMACATPAITTKIGGLPELMIDGETGFMSNVGDIDDMIKKAVYVLEDDARLSRFKSNALQRAKEFDVNKIVTEYESYYQEVISLFKAKRLNKAII